MQVVSRIVLWILGIFALLGALDRIIKELKPDVKLPLIDGFGKEFENGFNAMGAIALAQVGIIAVTPILARVLAPVVGPIYVALLSRPAMFAGTLLAIDMGGTPLGVALAKTFGDPEWVGYYGGLLLGSMFGVNLVFNIPVALGIIKKEDQRYLALGLLAGIVMVPAGVFVSGVLAGYPLGPSIMYLVPVIIVAILIAIGLVVAREAMIRGFIAFGHFIIAFILLWLGISVFQYHTGATIVPGLSPMFAHLDEAGGLVWEGIEVVGAIGVALAGAFPFVKFLTRVLGGPLGALGKALGMNEIAAAGIVATLANNLAMFPVFKDMNPRGKVINAAWQTAAAFTIADHLGFCAANAPWLIGPMIFGKLVAGILGVIMATFVAPKE